ncbi:MAG: peptidoglycan DD-metalloendopeptidase family protein [Thalassobaculum sp.]
MIANGFQHPFGDGVYTPEYDGDGFYISQHFDVPNGHFGNRHHRAEDWAQEGGANPNLPLVSPAHGTVLEVGGNNSHGNYIVISHQLPYSIVYDGYETSGITTVHLHLTRSASYADGTLVRAGDTLTAGQQFGIMGVTGQSGGLIHDHFEIRLDGDLGLQAGYEPGPVDLPWVDPTDFILAHRYMGAVTGTDAADAISANVGSDSVTGGLGADTLSGAGGGDVLYGNQGADLLFGNAGADTLFGGQDADKASAVPATTCCTAISAPTRCPAATAPTGCMEGRATTGSTAAPAPTPCSATSAPTSWWAASEPTASMSPAPTPSPTSTVPAATGWRPKRRCPG